MGFMGVYDSGFARAPTSTITVSKYFMGSHKSSEGNVVSHSKSKLNGAAGEKNKEKQENAKKNSRSTVLRLMWLRDITCGPRTRYSTLTIEANGAKWPVATKKKQHFQWLRPRTTCTELSQQAPMLHIVVLHHSRVVLCDYSGKRD